METRQVELKERVAGLFQDTKAREFAVNFVLPRLSKAEKDQIIKVAHVVGGKRADPDAAASAKAIAFSVNEITRIYKEQTGADVKFEHAFFGEGLTGPENSVFKRDCGITLVDLGELEIGNYELVFGYETVEVDDVVSRLDAVWDTHDRLPKSGQTFIDIRQELTATSMIAINYILPFLDNDNDDEIGYLAAALKYGIESDFLSSGFHRRTAEEKRLEACIDSYVKQDVLGAIHSAKAKKFDYWKILETQTRSEQYGSFVICMMGFLQPGQVDYLWRHANALIRTDGVSTVLCFGISDEKIVYKTRRDEDGVVDLNELEGLILKRLEREKTKNAGSRPYAGGGELNLCPLPKHLTGSGEEKKRFADGVFETLKERIAPLLAQNPG